MESWQWWMVGDTFLTRFCLAGCADFTVSYFHFHFPAKKSVQKGEVESDPRAGYFFNEVPCPPALRFTTCISWRTGDYKKDMSSAGENEGRPLWVGLIIH